MTAYDDLEKAWQKETCLKYARTGSNLRQLREITGLVNSTILSLCKAAGVKVSKDEWVGDAEISRKVAAAVPDDLPDRDWVREYTYGQAS